MSNKNLQKEKPHEIVSKDTILPFLPEGKPEYGAMLVNIANNMPAIRQSSSNFYKSHSQFMGVTVDVTTLTPLRSIKQVLAEIDSTKSALTSAYLNTKKSALKLEKCEAKLENATDELERTEILLKIEKLQIGMSQAKEYVAGAVRKLNFFVNQYNNLTAKFDVKNFSEADYEKEEAKYHILTALKQALIAARSRGGQIDEGNHIYFFELGVNGAQVQLEFDAYFHTEIELLKEGKAPTHEMTLQWMEALADKWKDCPSEFAKRRGFSVLDLESCINLNEIEFSESD
jgi:hypothetical protein